MTKDTEQKDEVMTSMLKAGVHFGHGKSKWHPKMAPYIFGVRNNVHIIDLEKTIEKLDEALVFMREIIKKDGKILFVGNKKQAVKIVEEAAIKCGMPYVANRWIGGTFTNFKEISGRVNHLLDLENKKATGDLKKYTKKEQLDFDKEMAKLNRLFGGIKELKKMPEAIFVIDAKEEKLAIAEAKKMHIPIVALCDTNYNPNEVEYAIPANDDAASSIAILVDAVVAEFGENKATKKEKKVETKKEEQETK